MGKMSKDELEKLIEKKIDKQLKDSESEDENIDLEEAKELLDLNSESEDTDKSEDEKTIYQCPKCEYESEGEFKYCPDCGAGKINWE